MALDQLLINPLDGSDPDSPSSRPMVVPQSQPDPEPIPISTAPAIAEPIAPTTAPQPEPMSWDQIWSTLGSKMPEPVQQAASAVRSVLPSNPFTATPAPTSEIDNSSRASFVRTAFPHMLAATDGDRGLAEALLAIAISENGDVGTGGGFVGNNFSGIKGQGSAGSFTANTWEEENGQRVPRQATFAAFTSPQEGFRAFGQFLKDNPRYHDALDTYHQTGDVDRLLVDINRAGYASDSNWAGTIANIRDNQVSPIVAGVPQSSGTSSFGIPSSATEPDASGIRPIDRVDYPLQQGLTDPDKWAVCGPIAAMGVAAAYGKPIDYETAKQKAYEAGWRPDQGMAGPASEVALLQAIGLPSHQEAIDWDRVRQDVLNGNPVIVSSPGEQGHYLVAQGVDAQGRINFGNSAITLKGGRQWMTPDDLASLGPIGNITTAIYMDNPTSTAPSYAVGASGVRPSPDNTLHILQSLAYLNQSADPSKTAKTLLDHLNDLTSYAQNLASQASGAGRDLADRATTAGGNLASGMAQIATNGNLPSTGNAVPDALATGFGFRNPVAAMPNQDDPLVRAVAPIAQAYQDTARGATIGLISNINSFAGGAVNAAGLHDTAVGGMFDRSRAYFENLQEAHKDQWAGDVDIYNPETWKDPKSYARIAGSVVPSVLAAMATGGVAAAGLGAAGLEAWGAAPLVGRLPGLGTRAGLLGSGAFTGVTSTGSTYEDLKKLGLDDRTAFVGGVISGSLQAALEAISPLENTPLLNRMFNDSTSTARRSLLQRVGSVAREIVTGYLKEGTEEGGQQWADNAVQRYFGSDKGLWDQVLENFVVGGFGSLLGAPAAFGHLANHGGPAVAGPQVSPTGQQAPSVHVAPGDIESDTRGNSERLQAEYSAVRKLIRETGRYDAGRPALIEREADLADRIARLDGSNEPSVIDGGAHPINETFTDAVDGAIANQNEIAGWPVAEWTADGLRVRVVRQQKPEQNGAISTRGGSYYAVEGNTAIQQMYARGVDGHGGPVRIDGTITLHNPYFVHSDDGNGTWRVIENLGAPKGKERYFAGSLNAAAARAANGDTEAVSDLHRLWGAMGLPRELLAPAFEQLTTLRDTNPEVRTKTFRLGVMETAASELLRRHGYDGMVAYDYESKDVYGGPTSGRMKLGEIFHVGDRRYPDQRALHAPSETGDGDDKESDLVNTITRGMEPVARDRPLDRSGSIEDVRQTLPLPPHRIGEVVENRFGTDGALALDPVRSNSETASDNDLPGDMDVDGYRLVGGPMRHGEETSSLIAGESRVPGTQIDVRGQANEHDQSFLDEIANRPYVKRLSLVLQQVHDRMQQRLAQVTDMASTKPSFFGEWLTGPNLLGSNAQAETASRNKIGIGVHETLHEVMLEARRDGITVGSPEFYTRVGEHFLQTMAHELVHNKYPDPKHKDQRRHALTDMLADAAMSGDAANILAAKIGSALGETGLRSWHADYVAIRERAQRGPATVPGNDTRTVEQLPADDAGGDGDGGQRGRPAIGPGLRAVPTRDRGQSLGDLGSGPPVPSERTQSARTDGVPPLNPDHISALINDYYQESNPETGDRTEAELLAKRLQAVLTPENVAQAISIAAVDYRNAKGERVGHEAASDQIKGRLKALAPELFETKAGPEYEYASSQLDLPPALATRIRNLAKRWIYSGTSNNPKAAANKRQSELAGDGFETVLHATIKYGFDEESVPDVAEALEQHGPVKATLGEVGYFPGRTDDAPDVVWLGINGDDLHSLRATVEGIEAPGDTPRPYQPHISLAYVRHGLGATIAARLNQQPSFRKLVGQEIVFGTAQVSGLNGEKITAELGGNDVSQTATITGNIRSHGGSGWTGTDENASTTGSTTTGNLNDSSSTESSASVGAVGSATERAHGSIWNESATDSSVGLNSRDSTNPERGSVGTTGITLNGPSPTTAGQAVSGPVRSAPENTPSASPGHQSSESEPTSRPRNGEQPTKTGGTDIPSGVEQPISSWEDRTGTTASIDASPADLRTPSSPSSTSTTSSRSATGEPTLSPTSNSSAPPVTDARRSESETGESSPRVPSESGSASFPESGESDAVQSSESERGRELPDLGKIPGLGSLNLDRIPPAFRSIVERHLTKLAKDDKQYPDGFGDLQVRRAAEAAGFKPDDPEYEARVEALAREIIGRDSAGRTIEIEALKRAIIESMLAHIDDAANISERMAKEGATPELLKEAEQHFAALIDQQDLNLRALRVSAEEAGRALRRVQLGLADAAEIETLQRYNALVKQIDPVKRAVEARVKAIMEGTATAGGAELSLMIRNLQALEKMGALIDFRIKTDEGDFRPLSTLTPEQMAAMSRDDVMRAMSAASRAWYTERQRIQKRNPDGTRSAMAAGAQDESDPLYRLGQNLVAEQSAHGDTAERAQLADERTKILEELYQKYFDAQVKQTVEEKQKGGTPESRLTTEEIHLAFLTTIAERDDAQMRAVATARARRGEAIGPVASQIRDYRNTENMELAAAEAAASHLARGLARLEERLGDNLVGNRVVDAMRAQVETMVADLALHPGSEDAVRRVYGAYERIADGDGQRFVDAALRVIRRERYVGNIRIDPDQVNAVSDVTVTRNLQRAVSGVLRAPNDAAARTLLQGTLDALRTPKYGGVGGRLADDLATLVAMEDARRIANEAIDEARKAPRDASLQQTARDLIDQVQVFADGTDEPWLSQRFAPMAYTLEERLDAGIERALEKGAGKEARALYKQVVADPGNLDAMRALREKVQQADPKVAADLLAMLGVRLDPSLRDAAAAGADPTRSDATRQSAADRLIERLQELNKIGHEGGAEHIRPLADEVLGLLDALGPYGQERAEQQRKKMRAAGMAQARMKNAGLSTAQWAQYSALIATGNPALAGRAMRLVQNPSLSDYVREWGVIAMLSAPTTWGPLGVNSVGNLMGAGLMGALWSTQLGYDMASSFVTGKDREIFASEAKPAVEAFVGGITPGLREAGEIMLHGNSKSGMTEAELQGEIRNLRTEWLTSTRFPPLNAFMTILHMFSSRPLAALDAFYTHTLYAATLAGKLERRSQRDGEAADILDHPELIKEAKHLTEYTLLQNKSEMLAGIAHQIDLKAKLRTNADPFVRIGAELLDAIQFLVVPFKTVPLNQIKQGLDRSVVAAPWHLARLGYVGLHADEMAAGREAAKINERLPRDLRTVTGADVLARGPEGYRDQLTTIREEQGDRASKLALGIGLLILGVIEAAAGHLTGDEPDDPDERRNWIAAKKEARTWNPFGLFSRGFSYDNTPFAIQLSMAATATQRSDAEYRTLVRSGMSPGRTTQAAAYGIAGAQGVASAIRHNFFLENLMQIAEGVFDNRGDLGKMAMGGAGEAVGRQIPNLLTYVARMGDDFERETKADGAWATFINRAVTQRIPAGWGHDVINDRADLPIKLRPLGDNMPSRYADDRPIIPGLPVLPGLTSWPNQSQERYSSTAAILGKYGLAIPAPPDNVALPGALPIQLTEAEKRIYLQAMGPKLAELAPKVYNQFASPSYVNNQRSILGASRTATDRYIEKQALRRYAIGNAQTAGMIAVINSLGSSQKERADAMRNRMLEELTRNTWEPDDEE